MTTGSTTTTKKNTKDVFKKHIENKKKEIPMYDPQTGEVNPLYEELTGKRNPLAQIRKVTSFGLLDKIPIPYEPYEPKRKNRFLITFPEELGIKPYFVTKSTRPSMQIIDKKFLGITYKKVVKWDNMVTVFIDPIGQSIAQAIYLSHQKDEKITYTIEMLDPTGVCVEKWTIKDCKIVLVDYGSLDYGNDCLAKVTMELKPSDVTLEY